MLSRAFAELNLYDGCLVGKATIVKLHYLFVTKLAPHLGTRYVFETGRVLVSRGHQVSILCAATHRNQPPEEVVEGMHVRAIRTAPSSWRGDNRFKFLATRIPFYLMAPEVVRTSYRDVNVVIEDVAPFWSPRLPRVCRQLGVPLIYLIHNVYENARGWRRAYGIGGLLGAIQERKLRSDPPCDALYSDARWTVTSLGEIGVPTAWVPNGVDGRMFSPDMSVKHADGVLRIINVGRLVPLKNHAMLLRAIAPLRDRGIELRIFGFGPELKNLEELRDRLGLGGVVSFHYSAGREQLIRAYREADLFVLPSLFEGMPLSVLEALACELPVAMSDIPAAEGLIEPEFGWRIDAGDEDSWTELIAQILEMPRRELQKLGRTGREHVLRRFTWDNAASSVEDLVKGLIDGRWPRARGVQ